MVGVDQGPFLRGHNKFRSRLGAAASIGLMTSIFVYLILVFIEVFNKKSSVVLSELQREIIFDPVDFNLSELGFDFAFLIRDKL